MINDVLHYKDRLYVPNDWRKKLLDELHTFSACWWSFWVFEDLQEDTQKPGINQFVMKAARSDFQLDVSIDNGIFLSAVEDKKTGFHASCTIEMDV